MAAEPPVSKSDGANGAIKRTLAIGCLGIPLVFVLLIVLTWVQVMLFPKIFGPSMSATFKDAPTGIEATVDLYSASPIGKAEFDRTLSVTSNAGTHTLDLFVDWGGADRLLLYRTKSGAFYLAGPATDVLISDGVPQTINSRDQISSKNGQDTIYLGVFRLTEGGFTFLPPDKEKECLDTLGAGEKPDFRPHVQVRSCPD